MGTETNVIIAIAVISIGSLLAFFISYIFGDYIRVYRRKENGS